MANLTLIPWNNKNVSQKFFLVLRVSCVITERSPKMNYFAFKSLFKNAHDACVLICLCGMFWVWIKYGIVHLVDLNFESTWCRLFKYRCLRRVHVVTCWLRNDPLGVSYRPKTPPLVTITHGLDFLDVRVLFLWIFSWPSLFIERASACAKLPTCLMSSALSPVCATATFTLSLVFFNWIDFIFTFGQLTFATQKSLA